MKIAQPCLRTLNRYPIIRIPMPEGIATDDADTGKVSQRVNESVGQRLNHPLEPSSAVLSAKSVPSVDFRIFASFVPFCAWILARIRLNPTFEFFGQGREGATDGADFADSEITKRSHALGAPVQSFEFKFQSGPKLRNEANSRLGVKLRNEPMRSTRLFKVSSNLKIATIW